MPKGIPNKRYTGEFKQMVVETMMRDKPGQTAWNNFGYHYSLKMENGTVEQGAMPLAVGAKIPSVPVLAKKLVDRNGDPLNATQDTKFQFRVTNAEGKTGEFTVIVPKDSSESGWVAISPEGWIWEREETYTVTETDIPQPYAFGKFQNGMDNAYSFVYDPAVTQRIVCQNVMDHWSLQLTKVDGRDEDTVLEGAEFKLYGLEVNTAETKEYEGQTWYLYRTGTTDDKGLLEWTELDQEKYLLVETKAPAGYPLPAEPYGVVTRSDTGELKLEVKNYATYELPETGGMGREWIFLAGTWLTALAALGLLLRRRKISV